MSAGNVLGERLQLLLSVPKGVFLPGPETTLRAMPEWLLRSPREHDGVYHVRG